MPKLKNKTYKIVSKNAAKDWIGKEKEWRSNAAFWIKIIRKKLDPFRLQVTDKAVLDYFDKMKGLSVLDAGCGEGYLCRELAKKGHKASGVDFNPKLIEAAKNSENERPLGVEYAVGNLKKLPFGNSLFDAVLSNHTINELDNPKIALKEFHRVLKSGGRIVLLFLHPCFDLNQIDFPKNFASRYFEAVKVKRECFIVSGIRSPSPYFYLHLALSEWTALINDAGFAIEKIEEPRPKKALMERDNWWKTNFKKPLFILIQAVKK